jgi:hypothetical protein
MKEIFESLDKNTAALENLKRRYKNICTNEYYEIFGDLEEKKKDLAENVKLTDRVLKMRYRLLENIQTASNKEMYRVSGEMRQLKLA